MEQMQGKKVLITGAAKGIGLHTAINFAQAGAELFISDIDELALKDAAMQLKEYTTKVHVFVVDVSKRSEVEKMAAQIIQDHGGIDILINNAGVGHVGEMVDTSLHTWQKLMDVNFWGPIYHVYAFLPSMIEKKSGHIVNVSSGQAFFRLPTWGAYATIKVALGAFSEILYYEVKKHGIAVTTVYPFMVNTGFYDDVKAESFGTKLSMKLVPYYSMTPQKVGKIIFNAIKHKQRVEMVHVLNEFAKYGMALSPISHTISLISNIFLSKRAN